MKAIVYNADGVELARWIDGEWVGATDHLPALPDVDDAEEAVDAVSEWDGFEAKTVATVTLPEDDDWMRRGREKMEEDESDEDEPEEVKMVEEMTEEEIHDEFDADRADRIIESLREEGVGLVAEDDE